MIVTCQGDRSEVALVEYSGGSFILGPKNSGSSSGDESFIVSMFAYVHYLSPSGPKGENVFGGERLLA